MTIRKLCEQPPFTAANGGTIRCLLDRANAPVLQQSLAEASLQSGGSVQRHRHQVTEESYFFLEGRAEVTVGEETVIATAGDAILIPPGAWHSVRALERVRFLCCCAPPYADDDCFFA